MSEKKGKAVLVALQLPGVSDEEHKGSLDELGRLTETLGFEVVGRVSQKRKSASTAAILGSGKLKELAAYTGGRGVVERFKKPGNKADHEELNEDYEDYDIASDDEFEDDELDEGLVIKQQAGIVIFDHELSPTQLKNLEDVTGVEVLDRTGVILEIFSRHAKSREARLQVEIAKLGYLAPRLRLSKVGGDRQGGGIGAKGAGESAHELDKRRIRDRIAELKTQLDAIRNEQNNRRSSRRESPCVALVGYTNAGKSSLMRALTGSEVLVADKLFATLDTTVRAMYPESFPRVLVSDTVGFIKKLPHDLVASFRSTLDEALNASLLLFTVDASDPNFRSQLEVTRTVLREIGADDQDQFIILNKVDNLTDLEIRALRMEFPQAIMISTRRPEDIKRVRDLVLGFFEKDMIEEKFLVPYSKGKLTGPIHEKARVLSEDFEDEGTVMHLRANKEFIDWLRKQLS
ncbi:MAG: GTPase HflX [Chitinophagaceae bacterium]|nr:GTPase HflX [Oligoflexus sp.]